MRPSIPANHRRRSAVAGPLLPVGGTQHHHQRDTAELGRHTVEAEKASRYASVRYQPNYARAQDVRDGYIADEMEGRTKIAAI
jgi:hypothetical protein